MYNNSPSTMYTNSTTSLDLLLLDDHIKLYDQSTEKNEQQDTIIIPKLELSQLSLNSDYNSRRPRSISTSEYSPRPSSGRRARKTREQPTVANHRPRPAQNQPVKRKRRRDDRNQLNIFPNRP